jgi:hypothetical protein
MALNKTILSSSGVEMTYHRISSIIIDNSTVKVMVGQYKDQAAREAGKFPVQSARLSFPKASIDLSSLMVSCYSALKGSSVFSGAADV